MGAVLVSVFLGRYVFFGYDAIRRSITDPPAGEFLYEDARVRIESGDYKRVSLGSDGDNDTYRHFIRQYLRLRDGIDTDAIVFNTDPYWDDVNIHVKYKQDGGRSLPALESIKDHLYPDGKVVYTHRSDGQIVVKPPPPPKN